MIIAGTHSGVGKTTIATGLMAALRGRGVRVASAKVGPDFIDPGYHSLATGRPPRNLDPWICGPDAMAPLAARAGDGAEMTIIEGVMGLFDGSVDGAPSSTADVAELLDAPVILVVDGSSMSSSVAALVAGYRDHRPGTSVRAVILNRVGSDHHRELLVEALDGIDMPVLGALGRDDTFEWRDRHLGLVPVDEDRARVVNQLDALGAAISDAIDLDAVTRLARIAPSVTTTALAQPQNPSGTRPRIAVAGGPAFTFVYRDNIEALEAAGAEVVSFDPLTESELPTGTHGLIAGGGFPEVFAEALADNHPLLEDLRRQVATGLVVWAECGGLLWLAQSLRTGDVVDGDANNNKITTHQLGGIVAADAVMTRRLTLGYREAAVRTDTPIGPVGSVLRGHEFHYSSIEPGGDALHLQSRFGDRFEGFANPKLLATYLHLHLGADVTPAQHFVDACRGNPTN